MENPEEVLQSLDEFAKLKPKDIPRELEEYLSYVAKTGDPVYQWSIVKCLFREKLLNVITDFYETSPTIDLPPCPNVDPFNYETMKNSLLERLDSFPSAPFTVQRLCELLTTPRKEYSRADKFMRAIEKNILVVSTREPGNVRRSDNNGQSEMLMNGVMDGRGIELGEAIETVSSDGVNIMHSDENEVNVTENENVPVECSGVEEIDMEEQGEQAETANSNSWDKERSGSTGIQNEEQGDAKNTEADAEEESKPKENPESSEAVSEEDNENKTNSVDQIEPAENIESSGVATEKSNESETSSSDDKPEVEETVQESIEPEAESVEPESNVESSTSGVDEKLPEQSEENAEKMPPDGNILDSNEKSVSEQVQDGVDSSSDSEDISKGSSADATSTEENSNEETVSKDERIETSSPVVPNTPDSVIEVTSSSLSEVTSETDSSNTGTASVETSTKQEENSETEEDRPTFYSADFQEKSCNVEDRNLSSTTDDSPEPNAVVSEVTSNVTEDIASSEVMSVAVSEGVDNVEETTITTSNKIAQEEVPFEVIPAEVVTDETSVEIAEPAVAVPVSVPEEEAMEVDETNTPPDSNVEMDEPMDQSEQPIDEQLES